MIHTSRVNESLENIRTLQKTNEFFTPRSAASYFRNQVNGTKLWDRTTDRTFQLHNFRYLSRVNHVYNSMRLDPIAKASMTLYDKMSLTWTSKLMFEYLYEIALLSSEESFLNHLMCDDPTVKSSTIGKLQQALLLKLHEFERRIDEILEENKTYRENNNPTHVFLYNVLLESLRETIDKCKDVFEDIFGSHDRKRLKTQ